MPHFGDTHGALTKAEKRQRVREGITQFGKSKNNTIYVKGHGNERPWLFQ